MCEGNGNGGTSRRGGPPGGNGDRRWVGALCYNKDPDAGGIHGTGNKNKTLKHYKDLEQEGRDAGLWFTNQSWYKKLRSNGIKAWFRWVFLSLDNYESNCKWRRFYEGILR